MIYQEKGLHCYRIRYKTRELRKKGFATIGALNKHLRQAMADIDAEERGEVRCAPTTAQEALNIYRRNLEVRAKDKSVQFAHNVRSNCKVLQEFVDGFGPQRLIRECTETDLREFYQMLCFKPGLCKNSAAVHVGRVQGMLKAAQEKKADLVNWPRPKLKVNRKTAFERRVVTPDEYITLVTTLLDPPSGHKFNSRYEMTVALWRDASDAVQLLRQTGGRLNEVLRIELKQFNYERNTLTLLATKTENERDLPLWGNIKEIVERRIADGLTSHMLFTRATTETFDNAIARACRKAGKAAKLNYGQANGFTCHSFRHTFTTAMMEATNNDFDLVMKYTGHKSLEAFRIYMHATEKGSILANQLMDSVARLLPAFEGNAAQPAQTAQTSARPKLLKRKRIAI